MTYDVHCCRVIPRNGIVTGYHVFVVIVDASIRTGDIHRLPSPSRVLPDGRCDAGEDRIDDIQLDVAVLAVF